MKVDRAGDEKKSYVETDLYDWQWVFSINTQDEMLDTFISYLERMGFELIVNSAYNYTYSFNHGYSDHHVNIFSRKDKSFGNIMWIVDYDGKHWNIDDQRKIRYNLQRIKEWIEKLEGEIMVCQGEITSLYQERTVGYELDLRHNTLRKNEVAANSEWNCKNCCEEFTYDRDESLRMLRAHCSGNRWST